MIALPRRRDERGVLIAAASVAVLFHLVLLALPLPRSANAVRPVQRPTPIPLRQRSIPPPPLPDPPPRIASSAPERRMPLPESDPLPTEPIAEPPRIPATLDADPGPLVLETVPDPPPPVDRVFFESDAGLIPPAPLADRTAPVYPDAARQIGLEGRVVLRAIVGADGAVESIELVQAPRPDLGFSRSAIAAVSRWRYTPGRYRGHPVAVSITVVVDFTLR